MRSEDVLSEEMNAENRPSEKRARSASTPNSPQPWRCQALPGLAAGDIGLAFLYKNRKAANL